ncbi:hypothetical protein ABZ135_21580 [Streptomyces sp. NPDC006339]|uniref:hypothetical protein n=1 Tax=Streptomyces sp. NPDC006339 TaxID=3156755 RepID=UPI0033B8D98A
MTSPRGGDAVESAAFVLAVAVVPMAALLVVLWASTGSWISGPRRSADDPERPDRRRPEEPGSGERRPAERRSAERRSPDHRPEERRPEERRPEESRSEQRGADGQGAREPDPRRAYGRSRSGAAGSDPYRGGRPVPPHPPRLLRDDVERLMAGPRALLNNVLDATASLLPHRTEPPPEPRPEAEPGAEAPARESSEAHRPAPPAATVSAGTARTPAGPAVEGGTLALGSGQRIVVSAATWLRPDGYVEWEGALCRARWLGPASAYPRPGDLVRVTPAAPASEPPLLLAGPLH